MAEVVRVSVTQSGGRRPELVARGRRLEYLTIAWNTFEAAVALASGVVANSVALVGFGLDSTIETASAVVLLGDSSGGFGAAVSVGMVVG